MSAHDRSDKRCDGAVRKIPVDALKRGRMREPENLMKFDAFEEVRMGCRRDTKAQDIVWVG